MTGAAAARARHLASFTAGSGLGLLVDLGGFWLLVHAHVTPGLANAVSSVCSIAVVYVFVTRRTFRARLRPGTFLLFAGWYALNIATVSVLIERAVQHDGHSPLLWKAALVPASFLANYAFNLVLHRWGARRAGTRIAGAGVVAVTAAVLLLAPAAPASATTSAARETSRIADLLGPGRSVVGRSFVIGGLGSSVGAGASLPDPGTQAPVAYFAAALAARVDPSRLAAWTTVNGSVNGSTIHDGLARDWPVLARSHPDVVVLAYGMNDGAPAQFESGETYAGAMHDLVDLIGEIRASGAVPVLLTSPSPHTGRFDFAQPPGPTVPQTPPIDVSDPVRQVEVPGYGTVPESSRHAAVDAGMRGVGEALGVDVVDVEPYWLRAVAVHGQDALFLPGEFVHPDLLGHRASYDAAIDAWLRGGAAQSPAALRPEPGPVAG